MSAVLQIDGLTLEAGSGAATTRILRGVDLRLDAGETLGIVGESGCGKSSTLFACLGLLPGVTRLAGSIRLEGRELTALSDREWQKVRGRSIACVFQNARGALHPMMTVGHQIERAWRLHWGGGRREAAAEAAAVLTGVGFSEPEAIARRFPQELSGGQCQRATIALAMTMQPKVLLADEPTSGLDHSARVDVLHALRERTLAHGTAVMIVTHDFSVVDELCDRVAVMYAGKVIELGRTADVLARPAHPYTRALLEARHASSRRLNCIPGSPPDLRRHFVGCAFTPRCSYATTDCAATAPALTARGENHQAACLYDPSELEARGDAA